MILQLFDRKNTLAIIKAGNLMKTASLCAAIDRPMTFGPVTALTRLAIREFINSLPLSTYLSI